MDKLQQVNRILCSFLGVWGVTIWQLMVYDRSTFSVKWYFDGVFLRQRLCESHPSLPSAVKCSLQSYFKCCTSYWEFCYTSAHTLYLNHTFISYLVKALYLPNHVLGVVVVCVQYNNWGERAWPCPSLNKKNLINKSTYVWVGLKLFFTNTILIFL